MRRQRLSWVLYAFCLHMAAVPVAFVHSAAIELPRHPRPVTAMAFTPDGGTLVTGSEAGVVSIISLRPVAVRRTLQVHRGRIHDLKISPNGKGLATAGADNTTQLISMSSFTALRSYTPPQRTLGMVESLLKDSHRPLRAGAAAVGFSGDTRLLTSAHQDQRAVVWDIKTGNYAVLRSASVSGENKGPGAPVIAAALSPDRRIAAAGEQETRYTDVLGKTSTWASVFLWDPYTSEIVLEIDALHSVIALAFLPDNRHLAGCMSDGRIALWQVSDGQSVKSLAHGGTIHTAQLSGNGARLVTVGRGNARIWELASGASRSYTTDLGEQFTAAALDADGSRIALAYNNGRVRLLQVGDLHEEITGGTGMVNPLGQDAQPQGQQPAPQAPVEKIWD